MENDNARQRRYSNEGMTPQEFATWAAERKIEIVPTKGKFKAGDIVVYTNEFGVSFEGKEILGFAKDGGKWGNCVYLNKDAYWFPNKINEISFEVPVKTPEIIEVNGEKFEMVGYDDDYRKLFKSSTGRTYVSVDGRLHTISDWGEPIGAIH